MKVAIVGGSMALALSLHDTEVDDVISPHELQQIAHAYQRTAGFDAEFLNNRPLLPVR